jgi:CheY-like chemotaxis protein
MGDPNRLRQIIVNLVGNAIKFTESGHVELKLEGRRTEAGQTWITFTVADTGIGISQDRIGSLFQEFTQGDSTIARRFGGTGLGLAISQRLTQKMGGAIRVGSELGQGTTLTVDLPVAVARLEDVRPAAHAGFSGIGMFPGCRVLLTEDNLINQKIGRQILERLGCQVEVAGDGKDAIAMAQTGRYDLILMDLHMPGVDGLQATREIRRLGIATPVIALTASVLDETRRVCAAAGMDGFIGKPISLDEISAVVRRFHPGSASSADRAKAAGADD